MFDGVRKRKVILKDAQNIGNRLEFWITQENPDEINGLDWKCHLEKDFC